MAPAAGSNPARVWTFVLSRAAGGFQVSSGVAVCATESTTHARHNRFGGSGEFGGTAVDGLNRTTSQRSGTPGNTETLLPRFVTSLPCVKQSGSAQWT